MNLSPAVSLGEYARIGVFPVSRTDPIPLIDFISASAHPADKTRPSPSVANPIFLCVRVSQDPGADDYVALFPAHVARDEQSARGEGVDQFVPGTQVLVGVADKSKRWEGGVNVVISMAPQQAVPSGDYVVGYVRSHTTKSGRHVLRSQYPAAVSAGR